LGACSGAVAGLVCITPAAGFVNTMPALFMGALAGGCCYLGCTTLKNKMGYDDSLDAFGVHGIGGIVGAVLTGVFATRAVNDVAEGQAVGLIDGNAFLVVGQIAAVFVTIVYALVVSLIILKIIDLALGGLRVTKDQESKGLDVTQHGEEGYIFY
jgi:Amt family ammonium transporter